MRDGRDTSAAQPRRGSGLLATVRRRVQRLVPRSDSPDETEVVEAEVDELVDDQAPPPASTPKPRSELSRLRHEKRAANEELQALTAERDRLRTERLAVQQVLGEQHGKRVLPRLKVEKTNGTASFVVGQRMMQRVHRRALDPIAGLDGVGAVFAADNPHGTATFAASHGVPVRPAHVEPAHSSSSGQPAPGQVVVHGFKGEVGLVEVHGDRGVRHLDRSGEDPGDIRPATPYDSSLEVPEDLAKICDWASALSAHIPRPYVQLVFARSDGESFLERVEVDPDRIPVLTPEWDERLGAEFDNAYSRFLLQPYRQGGLDNRVPGGTFSYEETR